MQIDSLCRGSQPDIRGASQNIFGFGQVRLLDDDVQIGEFSKRYVDRTPNGREPAP